MQRIRRIGLIGVIVFGLERGSPTSSAQFTASFQTNLVSAVTSNWTGSYIVGSNTTADTLVIQSSGVLSNGPGYLGFDAASSNNNVLVTGLGSVWQSDSTYVGYNGAGNRLVISNGGYVADGLAALGQNSSSSGNTALVTGAGSVWDNSYSIFVGSTGSGNHLTISQGSRASDLSGFIAWNSNSNNNVLVTDPGSVWSNRYSVEVGARGVGNSLVISNGAQVLSFVAGDFPSCVGCWIDSSNNSLLVTGAGSVWTNAEHLLIGYGPSNRVTVADGGQMFNNYVQLSISSSGSNNAVLITGATSQWTLTQSFFFGDESSFDSLVISNGGRLVDDSGYVGMFSGQNNIARVINGGIWQNNILVVGYQASSNLLEIAGGSVYATNLLIGFATSPCNNLVQLDSGSLVITSATHNAVLEVANGQLTLNGGLLQVDKLVTTNPCASFVRTGGTLIIGGQVVDLNPLRIISIARQGSDVLVTWMLGIGNTNALQVTAGGADGSYVTNGFNNVFTVLNNMTLGAVTNYLDVGGATNKPARYYRARLAP